MGKSANAGGGQAKAKGQAKQSAAAAEKDKADPKGAAAKEKASKVNAAAKEKEKETKGKDSKETSAQADTGPSKLAEEAQQKWADDDRDERCRIELREKNRQVKASGWPEMNGKRDKSIAKVTKFQNKLRLFKGEADLASVLSDVDGVDASKYVSELAECIMEAAGVTLKLKELNAASKVCSKLHSTYEEFGKLLGKALDKAYHALEASDVNRRRFLLRMCVELCLVEIVPAASSPLLDMVKEVSDITLPEEQVIVNFTILASLVQKHAVSCLNIVPSKQKAYEEALGKSWVERQCVLDDGLRSQFSRLVVNAYQSAAAGLLQNAHSKFIEQEKANTKLRVDKGVVDEENQKKYDTLKENLTKLQGNLSTLSEFLNQPMPSAQEENPDASRLAGPAAQPEGEKAATAEAQEDPLALLWEDSEQQRFYEEFLDLKDIIPAVLLNSGKAAAVVQDKEAGEDDKSSKEKKEEKKTDATDADKAANPVAAGSAFELYLMRVSNAESVKQIDDLVHEYFHEFNSKGSRRQLAQHLLSVHRNSLHLLAPHSRFICVVAPYLKEVPSYVLQGLQAELEQVMAEKDTQQVAMESKIKTVRYLCELCKFKICPPGVILDTIKTLMDKFSQGEAELCAHILQCCGRFLLYTPETQTRTENLLERMMRLKNVKSLPLRLEIMLEDAYYQIKPPEGKRQRLKEKEPLELFVEELIFNRLYKEEDEDKVLKFVRKLPWSGNAPILLKKCILELNLHANYESIYLLASLLSGLAKYRSTFVIETIDALFESVQTTIERNDFREMPLRVRQAKLIGELYNYRLIDSNLVFDTMYHFIGFGGPTSHRAGHVSTVHRVLERLLAMRRGGLGSIGEEAEDFAGQQLPPVLADPMHPTEPPWDFFRVKLACVLLETCGHYFDRGAVKQKLDRFLLFFQRYCQSKGELPLRVTFMVDDTLERIRPKMHRTTTMVESDEAIKKLLQSERENLDLSEEGMEEQEGEGDDDSSEESESSSGSDDDSSSGEGSESEDDDSDSDSDQEDVDYDRGSEAQQRQAVEIDEFDKEVQQMLIESLEREKHAPRGLVLTDLPAPTAQKRPEGAGQPGMFSLLQKPRGGKVVVKQIEIPEDSKLARVATSVGEAESKEKEEMKRYIISNYDQATSSGPKMIAQRPGKGGGKGGAGAFNFEPRGRKQADYIKEDFLPDEDDGAMEQPTARVRIVQGGIGGRGLGGGRYGGKGGPVGGGKGGPPSSGNPGFSTGSKGGPPSSGNPGFSAGAGKGGGHHRRRPEGKGAQGTPSMPGVRGSL